MSTTALVTHSFGATPSAVVREAVAALCDDGLYNCELNASDAALVKQYASSALAQAQDCSWCDGRLVLLFDAGGLAALVSLLGWHAAEEGPDGDALASLRVGFLSTLEIEEI